MRPPLTKPDLLTFLRYEPETGHFFWVRDTPSGHMGQLAGRPAVLGRYIRISIVGFGAYYAHRLAWLYMCGAFPAPPLQVDHIDCDGTNNRWSNLRIARADQNRANSRSTKNRIARLPKGVCAQSRGGYRAQICVNGNIIFLGRFNSLEEASAAYQGAARVAFGEFYRAA